MDLSKYDKTPPVGAAMTPFPYFVEADDPIERVEQLMKSHRIRHVPVKQDGGVIGVVSERDLHARERGVFAKDVLAADPYIVEITTSLHRVVSTMAERRLGCAVIVKHGKLAGILSVTDVCRVLASILAARFSSGGDEAA